MTPLYAYSLAPVLSVAVLLSFSSWRHRRQLGGFGLLLLCLSIAAWCAALMSVFFDVMAPFGQRFVAIGTFTAAAFLHAAYDYTEQQHYTLVWLAYVVATLITGLGIAVPGILHDPVSLKAGPLFWPAMVLAVIAAMVPSWTILWARHRAETDTQRRLLSSLLIAGLMCAFGAWGNALLLSSGRILPYGMLLVLGSLFMLARVFTISQPQTTRRLLDRSLLFSSLMALISAGFLFGILSVVSSTTDNLQQYRVGALFLFCMAALAFEPLRLAIRRWLGRALFADKIQTDQLAQHIEAQAEKLEHAERLAQLGVLTSAIAHEVRNPLGVLKAQLKILELQGASPETLEDMLHQIERASTFVDDLLRYGRPTPLSLRNVDPQSLLELARTTALQGRSECSTSVAVEIEADALTIEQVVVDQGQLLQLLVILIDNAILALVEHDEPRIVLHAYNTEDTLVIRVQDNGPGIQPELAETLFEPFTTGRRREGSQAGTGLGLAIARRIAIRHHASLDVCLDDRLSGACFQLILPLNLSAETSP